MIEKAVEATTAAATRDNDLVELVTVEVHLDEHGRIEDYEA